MRPARRLLTAALLTTLTLACGEQASAPPDPGAPELATRIDSNNDWFDFFLADVDNPCTAPVEAIDLAGRIHGVGGAWDNGHFLSHYDVSLSGVDGNGVRYQGASSGNGNLGSPIEDMVISTVINSTDGAPNFTTKIVLQHLKDGTVTVDKAGDECRG